MAEAVHESAHIEAGPEAVWDALMDPRQLGEWVSTHREITEMPPLPLSAGDSFEQKLGVGPVRFKVRWRVIEAERPELARWRGEGPGGSTAEVIYRLVENDGGTRFDYINDYELPGGVAGKAAKKAVSAAAGRREAKRSLKRLKRLLERG